MPSPGSSPRCPGPPEPEPCESGRSPPRAIVRIRNIWARDGRARGIPGHHGRRRRRVRPGPGRGPRRQRVPGPGAHGVLRRLARTAVHHPVPGRRRCGLLLRARGHGVTSSLACALFVPIALLRRRPAGEAVVGSMASGYVNAGNLGIPIATYVLGDPATVAPVLLFQLAILTPLFTTLMDILPGDGRGERPGWTRIAFAPLRNPIALATAAGLIVSGTGITLPEPVAAPIDLLADLAVPAMLLAFGISLHGARLPGLGDTAGSVWTAVAIKNVVHPLLAWALAAGLLGLTGPALLAAVVLAALPTAQNVFGYAVRYDRAVSVARESALASTIVAVPVLLVIAGLLS
ncbi:Auxin Efflux Carrier [Pseudonocardia sp. Ae263_Ps1]|nr:Auxin Efflux Carrier [Pseudonocardia sp. Ae150A_Ps1]OLL84102.1 Auxin Efflux Carrier [Pseudonocardia sp. Ae263_Ps1]OLL95880.1 Auxin Efflux Carrier [Pseudonocardia sp. Ae356_Ps1]